MLVFGNFTDYFLMTVELCLHDGVVQETYVVTFVAKVPTIVLLHCRLLERSLLMQFSQILPQRPDRQTERNRKITVENIVKEIKEHFNNKGNSKEAKDEQN